MQSNCRRCWPQRGSRDQQRDDVEVLRTRSEVKDCSLRWWKTEVRLRIAAFQEHRQLGFAVAIRPGRGCEPGTRKDKRPPALLAARAQSLEPKGSAICLRPEHRCTRQAASSERTEDRCSKLMEFLPRVAAAFWRSAVESRRVSQHWWGVWWKKVLAARKVWLLYLAPFNWAKCWSRSRARTDWIICKHSRTHRQNQREYSLPYLLVQLENTFRMLVSG